MDNRYVTEEEEFGDVRVVPLGSSKEFEVEILPLDAVDKTVTWSSSNESVATVSDGKVYGKGSGLADITATTKNGLSVVCTIIVQKFEKREPDPIAITIGNSPIKGYVLSKGSFEKFNAKISIPGMEDRKVVWRSDNEAVAEVVDGLVYAKSEGRTYIYAKVADGIEAKCWISVYTP